MRHPTLAVPVLLGAFLLAAVLLAVRLDRGEARATPSGEWRYLPRGASLRPALLGFHGVAADLLWLQIVQYVGGHYQTDRRYPQLAQALELATSLDPGFVEPYRLGALYLIYLAGQPEEGVRLLEKGIAANPDRWELLHDLGRYYYLEVRDYARALRYWEAAAKLPGAADYLPRFVARLYAQTGHAETALELWLELYRNAQNDHVRSIARREIARLEAAGGSPPTVGGAPAARR
jgi:tetratricopeptide (TPR) repeat protein